MEVIVLHLIHVARSHGRVSEWVAVLPSGGLGFPVGMIGMIVL